MAPEAPATLGRQLGYSSPPAWSSLAVTGADTTDPPELQWPTCVTTYDQVAKDAQVRQVINALILSVTKPTVYDPNTGKRVKGRWCLKPNGASPGVVSVCAEDLALPIAGQSTPIIPRSRGRFSFREHVRIALEGALVHGFMGFEQYGEIVADPRFPNGLGWRLLKLLPLPADTIADLKTDKQGGLLQVEQYPPGSTVSNSLSISGPRPVTYNTNVPIPVDVLVWYAYNMLPGRWLGNSLLRPIYKHWLRKDRLLRVDAVKHERNGMGIPVGEAPPGATITDMATMQAIAEKWRVGETSGAAIPNGAKMHLVGVEGSLPDTIASIRYDDEAIVGIMLTQFLKLGTTETGSRALGESFQDFFHQATDSVTDWLADVVSEHVIEDMVDWSWGEDEPAPRVGIEPDPDAPEPTPPLAPPAPGPTGDTTTTPTPSAARRRSGPAASRTASDVRLPARSLRRQPYDHEVRAATDFEAMEATYLSHRDDAVATWQAVRAGQITELVDQVEALVNQGKLVDLAQLVAPADGGEELGVIMRAAAEESIAQAVAEAAAQGVEIVPPSVESVASLIDLRAGQVEQLMARAIADSAARVAVRNATTGLDGATVAGMVKDHLEGLTDAYLEEQLGGAIASAQLEARREVIDQAPASVYASELLDNATCENCVDVDGREYSSVADADADYPTGGYFDCLGGPRCRGTLVAVYDEATPSEEDA